MTRKLATFSVRIIVAFILIATVTCSSFQAAADNNVTAEEAKEAALFYIDKFSNTIIPEWGSAKVSQPVSYYSIDKVKVAYEFTVLKEGKQAGFIIISSTKDWTPALEWGIGIAPSAYLSFANQMAVDDGYISYRDRLGLEPEILYWGAMTYSAQLGDKMKREGSAYHLPTGIVRQLPVEQPDLRLDKEFAQAAWASIHQQTMSKLLLDAYTNEISGVPAWFQTSYSHGSCDEGDDGSAEYPDCAGEANDPWYNWDGCAPISGAMVLGYWDNNGYSSFPNGDEALIDHCHYEMDTTYYGSTTVGDIDDGIEGVSQLYSYNFNSTIIADTAISFTASLVGEVDAGRPFVLAMTDHPTYGNHAVCGWGYYFDGFVQSIGTHDTWDTSEHWISFWSWDDAWLIKVIPGS